MIQWASLEELEPSKIEAPVQTIAPITQGQTECNIMVMMFIGGVLALALLDSVRG